MANELDELVRAVVRRDAEPPAQEAVSGPGSHAAGASIEIAQAPRSATGELDRLTSQLESLRRTLAAQQEAVQENTQTLAAAAIKTTGITTASNITKSVVNNLGGSLGVSPILTGIVKLFSAFRKSEPAAPTLTPFVLPPALRLDAGLNAPSQTLGPVSYGQGNEVRLPLTPRVSTPTVQVNINALDSQSFMDHSAEIAHAVKEAMLHAHSLNDVVQEL